MRTTLKRGLGRGAAPNGNGKAVLPPGTSSPMTLYRQPEPSGRSRAGLIGRVAMWLGIACLVVASGAAGGAYLYFHESVAAVAAKTPEVRKAARQLDVALPGQPAVALVIGYDARKGTGQAAAARTRSCSYAPIRPRTRSRSSRSRATCASRSAAPDARRSSTRSTRRTRPAARRAPSRRCAR